MAVIEALVNRRVGLVELNCMILSLFLLLDDTSIVSVHLRLWLDYVARRILYSKSTIFQPTDFRSTRIEERREAASIQSRKHISYSEYDLVILNFLSTDMNMNMRAHIRIHIDTHTVVELDLLCCSIVSEHRTNIRMKMKVNTRIHCHIQILNEVLSQLYFYLVDFC